MFNRVQGISIAEFEFPTYFNFFIKRKQVKLLTTLDREKRILRVFRETLLGPEKYQIAEDFPPGTNPGAFPRFKEEGEALDSFRKGLTISKLIQFDRFSANGKEEAAIKFGAAEDESERKVQIVVKQKQPGVALVEEDVLGFQIDDADEKYFEIRDKEKGDSVIRVPCQPNMKNLLTNRDYKPFDIPVFGITMLGVSHGFDKDGRTTGFVLWLNRRGIMVDPPPDASRILLKMGIPPHTIEVKNGVPSGFLISCCRASLIPAFAL